MEEGVRGRRNMPCNVVGYQRNLPTRELLKAHSPTTTVRPGPNPRCRVPLIGPIQECDPTQCKRDKFPAKSLFDMVKWQARCPGPLLASFRISRDLGPNLRQEGICRNAILVTQTRLKERIQVAVQSRTGGGRKKRVVPTQHWWWVGK